MGISVKTLGIDRLNVDERLALVEEIWATICVDAKAFPLTDEQRAELDRRVADPRWPPQTPPPVAGSNSPTLAAGQVGL